VDYFSQRAVKVSRWVTCVTSRDISVTSAFAPIATDWRGAISAARKSAGEVEGKLEGFLFDPHQRSMASDLQMG
jgi:hypothetical protein